mmetsp:Transcript_29473/g.59454  ORF Transcript_29473/g.59454 Transcript_29473/m.59454 type:complete len:270 (-) Transcript_29473:239-1048(-)
MSAAEALARCWHSAPHGLSSRSDRVMSAMLCARSPSARLPENRPDSSGNPNWSNLALPSCAFRCACSAAFDPATARRMRCCLLSNSSTLCAHCALPLSSAACFFASATTCSAHSCCSLAGSFRTSLDFVAHTLCSWCCAITCCAHTRWFAGDSCPTLDAGVFQTACSGACSSSVKRAALNCAGRNPIPLDALASAATVPSSRSPESVSGALARAVPSGLTLSKAPEFQSPAVSRGWRVPTGIVYHCSMLFPSVAYPLITVICGVVSSAL